jgi:hypothetical protein
MTVLRRFSMRSFLVLSIGLLWPAASYAQMGTLRVTLYGGEAQLWQTTLYLNTPGTYNFLWSPGSTSATSAEWQVLTHNLSPIPNTPKTIIVARGPVPGGSFAAGGSYKFPIDFKSILPAMPAAQPRSYTIRVVPSQNKQTLAPSSAVQLTYGKPGPPIKFDFLP